MKMSPAILTCTFIKTVTFFYLPTSKRGSQMRYVFFVFCWMRRSLFTCVVLIVCSLSVEDELLSWLNWALHAMASTCYPISAPSVLFKDEWPCFNGREKRGSTRKWSVIDKLGKRRMYWSIMDLHKHNRWNYSGEKWLVPGSVYVDLPRSAELTKFFCLWSFINFKTIPTLTTCSLPWDAWKFCFEDNTHFPDFQKARKPIDNSFQTTSC